MGSSPSKNYVLEPKILQGSKFQEDSSNVSDANSRTPKSSSFLSETIENTPNADKIILYGKIYKFSSSSGSLSEMALDKKQKIFLVTPQDVVDDMEHLDNTELVLNNSLPKLLPIKKSRVATLKRIQEEHSAASSRVSKRASSQSLGSTPRSQNSSAVSFESPFDEPTPSLPALLQKLGSSNSNTPMPNVTIIGSKLGLTEVELSPAIQSDRGSYASSSCPSPLSISNSNTKTKYSSRDNVGVMRVSRVNLDDVSGRVDGVTKSHSAPILAINSPAP